MTSPVFISHSSADQALAYRLVAAIERRGVACWLAARDIAAGANFQEEIVAAIQGARAMVLVFSASANRSGEMKKELALASQSGLTVIPLRIDDVKPDAAFAYELATRQWIDCGHDEEKATGQLTARLLALADAPGDSAAAQRADESFDQQIAYCRTADGVRLAYATSGTGPPLVKAANWMNHLDYDWESPFWGHLLRGAARTRTLLRYDARGNGLSDWDVDEVSLDTWVRDLETVVDAAGLDRFPLLGISQGCAVSIAYAVRHPERVSHLILYGGFAAGRNHRSPEDKEKGAALATLMRHGWGAETSVFRQMFGAMFMPKGTPQLIDAFSELQRKTTSAECAVRYYAAVGDIDVRELLQKVTAPTLVMHVRGDQITPFEWGRKLAAGIQGARFVALPGENHILLEHDAGTARFFEEIGLFLGE